MTASELSHRYRAIRTATETLSAPLTPEDCQVQSMDDASPVKWHLAHTSWFFETFVLESSGASYRPFHPHFRTIFNSYYQTVGPQHPRPQRGLVTRPGLDEVRSYRRYVDTHVLDCLTNGCNDALNPVIELGVHHEQQHQELILTDVKHLLSQSPLRPAYVAREADRTEHPAAQAARWCEHPGGIVHIGHDGTDFCFDNETPRHRAVVEPFQLASRPVANAEFLTFMRDGGYQRPELWLSDGWVTVSTQGWQAPLYWQQRDGEWVTFTLNGERPVVGAEPVCHVSLYEADAFARWAHARLPTEAEWEAATAGAPINGNFAEDGRLHPAPLSDSAAPLERLFGDVWEWTQSPYQSYPGYRPPAGALGEYNGKFMCNQFVLRGGSCVTPRSHIRATYRNFFPPAARWQFSGFRLARDLL